MAVFLWIDMITTPYCTNISFLPYILQRKKLIMRKNIICHRDRRLQSSTHEGQKIVFDRATVPETSNLGFNLCIDLSICFIAIKLQLYGN